jgi:hypothetical protein
VEAIASRDGKERKKKAQVRYALQPGGGSNSANLSIQHVDHDVADGSGIPVCPLCPNSMESCRDFVPSSPIGRQFSHDVPVDVNEVPVAQILDEVSSRHPDLSVFRGHQNEELTRLRTDDRLTPAFG